MDIKEVARLSGTSVATVSRVINNSDTVSPGTRARVQKVIEQTGYRPNHVGRNLRTQCSQKLLVMMPTISNPFYSDIIVSCEEHARANEYGVLLAVTNRNPQIERQYFDMLYTKQVDGVLSFLPTISPQEINQIASEYPFVACCWRGDERISASYVCIDNERAAYDMVAYLASLGHRRIAALNGAFPGRTYEIEREAGYKKGLAHAGIPYREEYYVKCDYSHTEAYQAADKLMHLPEPPTAIFAMSDDRAAGVIKYLWEHGYKPGVDVDVSGFDNVSVSEITTPSITTIAQPCAQLGKEAILLLIARTKDPSMSNKGIILAHSLIARGSTRTVS